MEKLLLDILLTDKQPKRMWKHTRLRGSNTSFRYTSVGQSPNIIIVLVTLFL